MSPSVLFCLGFHPPWTKTIEVLQTAEESDQPDTLFNNLSFLSQFCSTKLKDKLPLLSKGRPIF